MPDLLVGLVIQRIGERLVNPHALGERCRPMDRRGHQRVPEVHMRGGVDLDQPHLGGGVDRLDRQRVTDNAAGRFQQFQQPARGVDRRRQQQHAGLCRQLLHARRQRLAPGELSAAAGPAVARRPRSIDRNDAGSSTRASGLPAASRRTRSCVLVARSGACRRSSAAGRRVVQRREAELLEAGVGDRLAANGEQSDDRVGRQPPGDERQHVDRGRVQELGVVGDDQQRPV